MLTDRAKLGDLGRAKLFGLSVSGRPLGFLAAPGSTGPVPSLPGVGSGLVGCDGR
jgi:hypothetical protein